MSQWLKAHTLTTLRESKVVLTMCLPQLIILAWIFLWKSKARDRAHMQVIIWDVILSNRNEVVGVKQEKRKNKCDWSSWLGHYCGPLGLNPSGAF